MPPSRSMISPPPAAGYSFLASGWSPPKLNLNSSPPPAAPDFFSSPDPMTPPKSKSLTLSPPMAPAAVFVPNCSKPAPKSNPESAFSALAGAAYATGLGLILSSFVVFFLWTSSY